MRILNFGSMNLDYVYAVEEIVRAGETIRAHSRRIFCGGKGLNQSIALAKAGAPVWHAGLIGNDGDELRAVLEKNGVNTSLIREVPGPSSHTVIQVDRSGQNCILFYADEGLRVTPSYIDQVLASFEPGDFILLQNELDNTAEIMRRAKQRGMKVILNPSPANEMLSSYPLDQVDCFLLNETEGAWLTGEQDPQRVLNRLCETYPHAVIVLTLGEKGSICAADGKAFHQPVCRAKAVDTTAAGDSFTGYFLAGWLKGEEFPVVLERASRAAAIAVSRPGAADSIPLLAEVEAGME